MEEVVIRAMEYFLDVVIKEKGRVSGPHSGIQVLIYLSINWSLVL